MHCGRHVSPDTHRRSAERPYPRSPGRERPGSVPKPAGAGWSRRRLHPADRPARLYVLQPPSGGLRTEPGASAPGTLIVIVRLPPRHGRSCLQRCWLPVRPAVNGRAQSPSRLKPADPNGPRIRPIDPGAWAPHSPLQGACGLSPGLQPRAFAAHHSRRGHHRTAAPIGMRCRPGGPDGSGSA